MSQREKRARGRARGRPKAARVEGESSRDKPTPPGLALSNYGTQSSPPYTESTASQHAHIVGAGARPSLPGPPGFTTESGFGPHPPAGKVAIPSLRTSEDAGSARRGSKKGRISHACDHCQKAKAACTGEQPCVRCRHAAVPCVYGDGKRAKDRKRMTHLRKETNSLSQHQSDVTDALRRIRLDTNLTRDGFRAAIDEVLAMTPGLSPSDGESDQEARRFPSAPFGSNLSEEEEADGDAGSTGSMDVINVDTDRDDTRQTGHMGKSSAVAWAKRTAQECQQDTNQITAVGKHDMGFTLASYHTEDADVEQIDMSDVNPYDWPDSRTADTLIQIYFDHVHSIFPILDSRKFMLEYNSFKRGSTEISPIDRIWLGTVNAVFAITSVHAHLTKAEFQGHHTDHLVYCERAKKLGLEQGLLFEDARISTTRYLGLLCLYYITACRLNRAWAICGLAIRQALSLGLHVRNEVRDLSDMNKEQRVRVWWSLYSLECLLNQLTGRPSCISDRDISTPLPVNLDIDSLSPEKSLYDYDLPTQPPSTGRRRRPGSRGRPPATYQMPIGVQQSTTYAFPVVQLPLTPSTYFIYRTQLCIIAHEIVTQLYCAATIKEKWSDVQDTIRRIDRHLLAWRDSLPPELDIEFDTWNEPNWNDPYTIPRIGLAMLFTSSRMILFRPCLCRFEGKLDGQSEKSRGFNQEAVKTCIRSARKMISLLSCSTRSVKRLYSITPWWNTLHYLCEALSVLMLEIAFRSQHVVDESAYILEDAKKGINWLAMMAEKSVSARKAWEILDSLIRVVAPMIRWSVFDMPMEAPIPPGYNWRRFNAAPVTSPDEEQGINLTETNLAQLNTLQSTQSHLPPHPQAPTWQNQEPQLGYLTNPSYPSQFEQLASNPLDQQTALQRFSNIGNLHGHYDDPWHDLFDFANTAESGGTVAPQGSGLQDEMGNMGSITGDPSLSENTGYPAESSYNPGAGQYGNFR